MKYINNNELHIKQKHTILFIYLLAFITCCLLLIAACILIIFISIGLKYDIGTMTLAIIGLLILLAYPISMLSYTKSFNVVIYRNVELTTTSCYPLGFRKKTLTIPTNQISLVELDIKFAQLSYSVFAIESRIFLYLSNGEKKEIICGRKIYNKFNFPDQQTLAISSNLKIEAEEIAKFILVPLNTVTHDYMGETLKELDDVR